MNNQTQAPLAALVTDYYALVGGVMCYHRVRTFESIVLTTAKPEKHDRDWTEQMPVRVEVNRGGELVVLWERDFSRKSFPYPIDVDGQVVIGFLANGKLVKVISLRGLRDGVKLEPVDSIALKKATARVLGVRYELGPQEHEYLVNRERAPSDPATAKPEASTPPTTMAAAFAAPTPAKQKDSAPVKAPAPSASAATPEESAEAHKKAIAERLPITVYDELGKPLAGIPVQQRECKFVTPGMQYVVVTKHKKPTHHFTCVRVSIGVALPYDELSPVTAEMPAHKVVSLGGDAAPLTMH